jgi:CubicO group peptidase (beta-lactamase class C family)
MLTSRQSDLIQSFMSTHNIPGVAAAVVADGEIVAEGGVGVADIGRENPATERTRWPICSLTKAFTGVAAMQLVERGRLRLDEPVTSYIPGFRTADRAASDLMTTRMFLRHNSGMGRAGYQDRLRESKTGNPYPTRESLVAALHDAPLQSAPGACWSYCNEGYVVAGRTVELLSGKPLERVFQEEIFARAGMADSAVRFADWRAAGDRMAPYGEGDMGAYDSGERHGGGEVVARLPEDYQTFLSTGGISSTAHDLALFQLACMDYAGSPLLTGGSLDHQQSVQFAYGDTGWGYGFGWQVFWSGGTRVVGHAGGLPGVSTYSLMVPGERIGAVVLANRGDRKMMLLAEELVGELRGKPLWRDSIDEPLPFRTEFAMPVTGAGSAAELSGEYAHKSGTARVSGDGDGLRVHVPGNRGGADQEISLVAVSADTFLEPTSAQVLHFVRDDAGAVARMLDGGYAYERAR